ncbi:MAG: outer membrane lipoprotein chaperone LolA [Gammaproteobacteria bacterium]|nr:outer membrane lipoprotein chaperone LolA [Gammaproteobacteria bacterium]
MRSMKTVALWLTLAIAQFLSVHQAAASVTALQTFFNEVSSLEAQFTQRVTDERGMLLEQSSGIFSLSRPGKFRWDYRAEDGASSARGTQIVADGEYLYMYDPELKQMSQRRLQDALGQVPSLLLVQSEADIEHHFVITELGLTDGLTWVALKPRDPDAGYQQLMIGFFEQQISQIVLLDGLGNETRLQLTGLRENLSLPAGRFSIKAPAGTDILFQ